MTPQEFIRKWKPVALSERATAQEHFLDLCRLFDHPTPVDDDPTGERFTFEKGVVKSGGGDGFADVWKKGFFAWEYKKKKRNLDEALIQLVRYAAALENPPLHVVCDTVRFRIVTAWTNTVPQKYEFELEDLAEPENLRVLRAVFQDPESLRPKNTRAALTRKAADQFQTISDRLQQRNPDRVAVAHFVNQLVFCFFADSVKLLPEGMWRKLLEAADRRPKRAKELLDKLFMAMHAGEEFDLTFMRWFNGGLFDGRPALALEEGEIGLLFSAAILNWGLIDPTIFGTLFERFLDPDKRAQIGAHYTDPDKIMMIVDPVVLRPLRAEWAAAKAEIEAIMKPVLADPPGGTRAATRDLEKRFAAARAKAEVRRDAYIDRLCAVRILDPACGSGNFLYLALQGVKDLENQAILECQELLLGNVVPRVGPEILHGIEINPFAAELARTTIWIGDIQWRIRNAIPHHPEPILRALESIECRDAVLMQKPDDTWAEAEWPEAEFIIGNPPFLGGKLLRNRLGDSYVEGLFGAFEDRVPAEADLVAYWVSKAWNAIATDRADRAGLVTTNSIRGGPNRRVLAPIADAHSIFEAWSDEPWVLDGAAVRVSLTCFGDNEEEKHLDGALVTQINADLTGVGSDMTRATRLIENAGVAFMGDTKGGAFDVSGDLARAWLTEPLNANGRPNSDVLKPWINGLDVTRRPRDMWIVDFGWEMSEREASFYEQPFAYLKEHVKPERQKNRRPNYKLLWWRHVEPRPGLRAAIDRLKATSKKGNSSRKLLKISGTRALTHVIVTPTIAKHRLFARMNALICPDHQVIVIARDDDTTFGVLHSRFHEGWSLRLGTSLEDRPRYTPTTTFETFPFPEGLTPNIPASSYAQDSRAQRIAAAASTLDERRRAWLNPPDLVEIVPEVVPGYPDRVLPRNVEAAAKLKERTLTNLYNQCPQWLADAHADLDRAVAAAYGWPENIETEEALVRLLALNAERAAASASASSKAC